MENNTQPPTHITFNTDGVKPITDLAIKLLESGVISQDNLETFSSIVAYALRDAIVVNATATPHD
jgi:hypothetical protein